mmetsp:Transcript_11515/g.24870  ORF Transcript_11515/g.24870 Transcript_11515/m.24870 type:complete len:85 (-) Transcript_11515:269-523(-)|eukprot:444668-Pleurochrysis_carterae.AAC.4
MRPARATLNEMQRAIEAPTSFNLLSRRAEGIAHDTIALRTPALFERASGDSCAVKVTPKLSKACTTPASTARAPGRAVGVPCFH